ncbi:MAG: PAS domain-containing protein [Holophaga sp.]|nr:PAS domain-containing protein [Holophaga sp.]
MPMNLSHLSPEAMQQALIGLLASFRSFVAIVNTEGIVVAVNPAWADFKDDNPFITNLVPGDDYQAVCNKLLGHSDLRISTVAMGIQSAFKGKMPLLKLDYQVGGPQSLRWYGLQVTAPDPASGIPGVIIHADITEKMLLQRSLRRIENLFKITTENAADLIAILDTRKGTVFASPSHTWTLGYSKTALEKIDYAELIHEDDLPLFKALMSEGATRSMSRTLQFRVRAKNKAVHLLECRVATVESASGDHGTLLLVSREITERNHL